jgi:hypothetical protein
MIKAVELYQTWATELAHVHQLLLYPERDWDGRMYRWLGKLMHHYVSIPYDAVSLF